MDIRPKLAKTSVDSILPQAKAFKEFTSSKRYTEEWEDREEHRELVKNLTAESLMQLDEFEFRKMLSQLWAFQMWGSKEYPLRRILDSNDFTGLKGSIADLLFGEDDVETRFDRFASTVRQIGPAIMSELMCLARPDKYAIWNAKARDALSMLGFSDSLRLDRSQLSGSEYSEFLVIAETIRDLLSKNGFPDCDLLMVDYFLYFVSQEGTPQVSISAEPEAISHNQLVTLIRDIGEWLGFVSATEQKIAKGTTVDVVWSWRIGNVGEVKYVFEVQKGGNEKSALFNLLKALSDPSVQRVVVISDKEQLDTMIGIAEGLPMGTDIAYWDEEEVLRAHTHLEEAYGILSRLRLMKPSAGGLD